MSLNLFDLSELKKQYEKDGYAVIENFYSKDKCEQIKEYAFKKFAIPPDFSVALNVHRESEFFFKIISDKEIVNLVNDIQDSDFDAVNDQYLFKKANSTYGKQSWTFHQDNSYPRAPKGSYIIVHLAIDDSHQENGGLIFLPGSHKEEILEFKPNKSWREEKHVDGITRPGQTITSEDILNKYPKVDLNLKKGSLVLMHGNLIHGSHPNLSKDQDRNQYSMAYMNKNVDFFEGINSKRIRVSVQ